MRKRDDTAMGVILTYTGLFRISHGLNVVVVVVVVVLVVVVFVY